jgi:hypothetical protein
VALSVLSSRPGHVRRPGYWQRTLADQLFAESGHEPPAVACEGDEPYAIRGLISAAVSHFRRSGPAPP